MLCMVQVVGSLRGRQVVKVSAVSPQEQPLVQLMLPAARELAGKAPGRTEVGASGLECLLAHKQLTLPAAQELAGKAPSRFAFVAPGLKSTK